MCIAPRVIHFSAFILNMVTVRQKSSGIPPGEITNAGHLPLKSAVAHVGQQKDSTWVLGYLLKEN